MSVHSDSLDDDFNTFMESYIVFELQAEDCMGLTSTVEVRVQRKELYPSMVKCRFLERVLLPPSHNLSFEPSDRVNLTSFKASSFFYIMNYIKLGGSVPPIPSSLNQRDIYDLALYLDLPQRFFHQKLALVEDNFFCNLSNLDLFQWKEEEKVRRDRFENEYIDKRSEDEHWLWKHTLERVQRTEIKNEMDIDTSDYLDLPYKISSLSHLYEKRSPTCGEAFIQNRIVDSSFGELRYTYPVIGNIKKSQLFLSKAFTLASYIRPLFHAYTKHIFEDMDWTDIMVAGGSIFTLLTHCFPSPFSVSENRYVEKMKYLSDVDFFLTTKEKEKAEDAIRRIVSCMEKHCKDTNRRVSIVRSKYTITIGYHVLANKIEACKIKYEEPTNSQLYEEDVAPLKIQIILRLYNSIAQALSGFDLDSSAVGFDGKELYCMDRFIRCLVMGYNLVDPHRQSSTYAKRLLKYLTKGVSIALPGWRHESWIQLQKYNPNCLSGLAYIVSILIHRVYMYSRYGSYLFRPSIHESTDYGIDLISTERTFLFQMVREWIRMKLSNQSILLQKERPCDIAKKYNLLYPFLICTTIEDCLKGEQLTDELIDEFILDMNEEKPEGSHIVFDVNTSTTIHFQTCKFHQNDVCLPSEIRGPIEFRMENPGSQSIGSFQPTNEQWYDDIVKHAENHSSSSNIDCTLLTTKMKCVVSWKKY